MPTDPPRSPPLPEPPRSLPGLLVLPSGTVLHRVAIDNLGGTEFSRSSRARRFSPIHDAAGDPIGVLYAATTLDGALAETIFHDTDDDHTRRGAVLRTSLHNKRASVLHTARRLSLADLTDPALPALGVSRAALTATGPAAYPATGRWGQALHDRLPHVDGLVWNSRRDPQRSRALMLFADRVDRRALDTGRPLPLYDGDGLAAVLRVAVAMNVTVVV